MSDAPPSWIDDVPPPDANGYAERGGNRSATSTQRRGNGRDLSPEQIAGEAAAFYAWIDSPQARADFKTVLPDHIDIQVFISSAKTAVMNKPQLLRPDLRSSLLVAISRAAGQGLKPDGKEGALVPRYDTESSRYAVAWQPMVWGITKLGRETGAIKTIRAVIAFQGEQFQIIQGDEDRIDHVVDMDIVEEAYQAMNGGLDGHKNPMAKPDEFFKRVRAAYCLITAPDGTVTKRWMTRERLRSLRDASRAGNGPWNSRWVDEMVCKAVILFTAKWIDLDTNGAAAKRFHAALMTDMEIDFDAQAALPQASAPAALPAPGTKLDVLEGLFSPPREQETVPAVEGAAGDAGRGLPSDLREAATPADTREAGGPGPTPPASPPQSDGDQTQTKAPSPRRVQWVAAQEAAIAALPDHPAMDAYRGDTDLKARYDLLRQENPELARRIDEAISRRVQTLGPPQDDGGEPT